jgi:hypothetical protein
MAAKLRKPVSSAPSIAGQLIADSIHARRQKVVDLGVVRAARIPK